MTIALTIVSVLLIILFVSWLTYFFFRFKRKKPLANAYSSNLNYEKIIEDKLGHLQNSLLSQKEDFLKQKTEYNQLLNDFKDKNQFQNQEFIKTITTLDTNLKNFEQALTQKDQVLKQDLNQTNSSIDKKIIDLMKDVNDLKASSTTLSSLDENVKNIQRIFVNSKKRGNLGEYLLETLLHDIYGGSKVWESQYHLPSGQIIDAFINLPEDKEGIAIDSKFSLENYNKYFDASDKKIQQQHLQDFKRDLKNRIDEVAKYISHENKISSAIMFIPSENIFSFIYSELPDEVVGYAFKKQVWMSSPTILSAILFAIDRYTKEVKIHQNLEIFKNHLHVLRDDWQRWIQRWDDFRGAINKIPDKVDKLDITHKKIVGRYNDMLLNSEFNPQVAHLPRLDLEQTTISEELDN